MKLFEIALPEADNSGNPLQHGPWCYDAMMLAGGYTKMPTADGVWIDKAQEPHPVYQDRMVGYRVACDQAVMDKLTDLAFTYFPDQVAIFVSTIGTAKIVARPSILETYHEEGL